MAPIAKTELRDLVIILPGIAGSVLQKDNRDIWNFSGQSIWQLIQTHGNSLNQLKLEENTPSEGFDDGIVATSLVRGAHIIPGLEKFLSGYHITSQIIKANFELTEGNIIEDKPANFFEFPYDWRLDNRFNAKLLKTFLDRKLSIWREHTGSKDAKVILLAHSMGGLISRYYLEVLEGWQDCKALFTFGTPYRGSIDAIDFLANDHKLLKVSNLNNVLRSFPSVYQLLPRHTVLKVCEGYQSIAQSTYSLPNINPKMALDAWNFHGEIEAAVNRHLNDDVYRKDSYKIIPIVGIRQNTKQSAILENGKITISKIVLPPDIDPIYGGGDGTVPYWSAIPQELSYEYRETYISTKHSAIQSNSEVLRQVRDRIHGMQSLYGLGPIRGSEVIPDISEQAEISFSVDDLYLEDETITICTQLKNTKRDFGGIKAEIQSLSNENSLQIFQSIQAEDSWVIETGGLAPGVYQIKVQTIQTPMGAPSPILDIFEVI
jgi:Lecithin:cholesterol acyltransferase